MAPIQDTVQRTWWVVGGLSLLVRMLAGLMWRYQWSLQQSRAQLAIATHNLKFAHDEIALQREALDGQETTLAMASVALACLNSEKAKRAEELALAKPELTNEREEADKLSKLSFYDPLTNLPNHRLPSDRMTQMLASSRRTGRHLALMLRSG